MIFKKECIEIEIKDLTTRTIGKFLHLSGIKYEMLTDSSSLLKDIFKLVDECYSAVIELKLITKIKINDTEVTFDQFDNDPTNFSIVTEMMVEYINHNLNTQKKTT